MVLPIHDNGLCHSVCLALHVFRIKSQATVNTNFQHRQEEHCDHMPSNDGALFFKVLFIALDIVLVVFNLFDSLLFDILYFLTFIKVQGVGSFHFDEPLNCER